MIYQIKSYLKFLSSSTNQHGVHSPFIYDLVTNCFYDSKNYSEYRILKSYRKKLVQSKQIIHITDFGEGSRVFTSNERKVAAIAKTAGVTKKRQKLLFRLIKHLQANTILELGTSLGLGTIAMNLGNPSATITTVEGCPATAKVANEMFKSLKLEQITLHNITFEDFFERKESIDYDVVYIDGNHNGPNTMEYFERLLDHKKNETVLIFDDIYWSAQMTQAWHHICEHPEVTVSIDLFHWGIIFFRKEQQKEHFKIRL